MKFRKLEGRAKTIAIIAAFGLILGSFLAIGTYLLGRNRCEMNNKSNILKRNELKVEDTWKLEDMYSNDQECQKDIDEILQVSKELAKYEGKMAQSSSTFLEFLNKMNSAREKVQKVYVYSFMRSDQDGNVSFYKTLKDKAVNANMALESATAFFVPEVLSMEKSKIDRFFAEQSGLEIYRMFIDDITRVKEHVLSSSEEQLMALTAEMARGPHSVFESLIYTDLRFASIDDGNGNKVQLTNERYQLFMENTTRKVRQEAYEALYSEYGDHKNTFASLLNANAKTEQFSVTTRKFDSSLEMNLFENNIPVSVYTNLIETVKGRADLLHRYVALRKKALGQDEIAPYDMHVALEKEFDYNLSFKEAEEVIYSGLGIMGSDYLNNLNNAFAERWIDPYENVGKRSGAYAWGSYGSHPYVLMNWQSNTNSLFTLAHELGHAMHFHYAFTNQPFIYSGTPIFIAEVASTVNEVLLVNYLIDNAKSEKEVRYLLEHMIKTFVSTVYRQTQFAEFELIMHQMVERGEALTQESLSEAYAKLLKEYYGPDYIVDDMISLEWARIPHFYNSFYVYQYATGYSAAIDIASRIRTDEKAKDSYIEFLKAGNSDYPIEVLKIAGVDMTTKDPISNALDFFEKTLEKLEAYYK